MILEKIIAQWGYLLLCDNIYVRMTNHSKHKNTTWGFTMIEILVIIFIMSLLASIVLFSGDYRAKARDLVRQSDINTLLDGLIMERLQYGFFPCTEPLDSTDSPNPLKFLVDQGVVTGLFTDPINNNAPFKYIYSTFKEIPTGHCGLIAHIDVDFETPSVCPYGQFSDGSTINTGHCHVFYPHPPKCDDPWHFLGLSPNCGALSDDEDISDWGT